jgi:hypothetical protein
MGIAHAPRMGRNGFGFQFFALTQHIIPAADGEHLSPSATQ